ncbi:MAG TPA: Mini-ribonuclease 3 [Clostridiaceae bacterium]|nr:Mini-ribonuclease 3 [Clostridiaceae bacterium]
MDDDFFKIVSDDINIPAKDVKQFSPLVLAYVGDAVFELYVRTYLVSCGKASVHTLHIRSINYVKARAQAHIAHNILELLTDEEKDVLRRGRNAKSATVPKNADIGDYRYATGFESLIGYLYLTKQYERLNSILKMSLENADR